jgi:hypothetical protein
MLNSIHSSTTSDTCQRWPGKGAVLITSHEKLATAFMIVSECAYVIRLESGPDHVAEVINAKGCFRGVTEHFDGLRRIWG